jgi:hypothetical protein
LRSSAPIMLQRASQHRGFSGGDQVETKSRAAGGPNPTFWSTSQRTVREQREANETQAICSRQVVQAGGQPASFDAAGLACRQANSAQATGIGLRRWLSAWSLGWCMSAGPGPANEWVLACLVIRDSRGGAFGAADLLGWVFVLCRVASSCRRVYRSSGCI